MTTIDSGTQSATAAHALGSAATTTAGVYVAMWNLDAMANGHVIKCYVETKVLAGDTARRIYEATFQHDQGDVCVIASPPIVSMHSIRMYVEEVGAATVSVPWALISL